MKIFSCTSRIWIASPYADLSLAHRDIQEELLEVATNEELEANFTGGYQRLWLGDEVKNRYPTSWNIKKELRVGFPSSYLVVRAFSAVANLMATKRTRHGHTRGFALFDEVRSRHPGSFGETSSSIISPTLTLVQDLWMTKVLFSPQISVKHRVKNKDS